MSRRDSRWLVVLSAAVLAIGCSKGAEQRRDTATASAAVGGPNANPVDTGRTLGDTAGLTHGDTTRRPAPKDSTRTTP